MTGERRRWMSLPSARTSFVLGFLLLWFYYLDISSMTIYPAVGRLYTRLTKNYFRLALQETRGALLIDTPKCQLPAFDTFGEGVRRLMTSHYSNCSENARSTYVEQQKLVINETELRLRGYSFQNVSCCYHTISRVEQTLKDFDMNADRRFRYSDKCYPMNLTTEPLSGFIVVNCTAAGKNGTIYRNFHAFPKFSTTVQAKLSVWKGYTGMRPPPSVLLLGIDSTSRLHFRRSMRKTRELLEELGAVEMKGYTRIGENTCLNIYPVLVSFSHSLEEVERICELGNAEAMDNRDFLWKHFSNQNYVTGLLEDYPWVSNFNHEKTGFVQAPTDLYIRPWMQAAYSETKPLHRCLGYQRPDEVLHKYTYDSVALLYANRTPYFIITWITELTHSHITGLQALDDPLSEMIGTMHRKGMLENTVLILMGDHGYRSGVLKDTTSGWFENNLPLLYIRLPEVLRKRFPEWQKALQYNSGQLTSHLDLHETLKDILTLSSPNSLNVTEPLGRSLFRKVPLRSCDEANIPSAYCVCLPKGLQPPVNNSVAQYCVDQVINKINRDLPPHCAKLSLLRTKAVTIKSSRKNETVSVTDYSVSFDARPSDFQFEAVARYDNNAGKVVKIAKIQRTNRKTQNSSCLRNHEAHLELFCTCV